MRNRPSIGELIARNRLVTVCVGVIINMLVAAFLLSWNIKIQHPHESIIEGMLVFSVAFFPFWVPSTFIVVLAAYHLVNEHGKRNSRLLLLKGGIVGAICQFANYPFYAGFVQSPDPRIVFVLCFVTVTGTIWGCWIGWNVRRALSEEKRFQFSLLNLLCVTFTFAGVLWLFSVL